MRDHIKGMIKHIPIARKGYSFFCAKKKSLNEKRKRREEAELFEKAREEQQLIREGATDPIKELPLHVHWEITSFCNYRCSYCFQAAGGHKNNFCSLEQAKIAVEHLASANRPSYQIEILGGRAINASKHY